MLIMKYIRYTGYFSLNSDFHHFPHPSISIIINSYHANNFHEYFSPLHERAVVEEDVTGGIFFRAKREQLLDTEPQKKPNPCRWESGVVWLRGKTEDTSDSPAFVFFFLATGTSTMLFRARGGIPPRRIVIYGTTVPPRKEQSSSPRRDIAFYVLPPRDTRFVSLLFCCFVALCNRDDGLKSKMVSKSPLLGAKWRVCISDNEIVCTLFRIECGKRRVLILHLVLLAQSWSWSASFEICLEFSPIPVKIAKID